MKLTRNWRL